MDSGRWFLTQMHLHAGSEQYASMRSHAEQAKRLGYDAIFITEHDTRLNRMPECIEDFHFGHPGEAINEDIGAGFYTQTGEPCSAVERNGRFAMPLNAGEHGLFASKGKRHQVSLAAEVTLTLFADIPEGTTLYAEIVLSQKPDLELRRLVYRIGENTEQAGDDPWIRMVPGRNDGLYVLRLSEDARNADPLFGLDNAWITLELHHEGEGTVYVYGFATARRYTAEALRKRQIPIAQEVGKAWGVKVYPAFELSYCGHRNCFSRDVPVIDYEETGYTLSERTGSAYLRAKGAVFALNHMFSDSAFKQYKETVTDHRELLEKRVDTLLENRCEGACLMEVGFPEGRYGYSLDEHLEVWDRLCMSGIRITGYGDSDSHDSSTGWDTKNCFGTWLFASDDSWDALTDAMRAGHALFGDPRVRHTDVSYTAGGHLPGGEIRCAPNEPVPVAITYHGDYGPYELRVIAAMETVYVQCLPEGGGEVCTHVTRGKNEICPVRFEILREGQKILISNPVYLVR